jgi:hypothetical protein
MTGDASNAIRCRKEENLKACPCDYPGCPRKGLCCECAAYHKGQGGLPACLR